MESLLSFLLIGASIAAMTENPRSLVLSIMGFRNSSGYWVTNFTLNRKSDESMNNWKLDIQHNVYEYDGVQELTLHGIFSEHMKNDSLDGVSKPFEKEQAYVNNELSIVPREEWQAKEAVAKSRLPHPVEAVIVRDELTAPCTTPEECIERIRKVQDTHLENPYGLDIEANFLIGGDGRVYEGRGWDIVVDEVHRGLVISFVGRYDVILPSQPQIDAFAMLIEEGVKRGEISPYYKLFAFRQLYHNGYPGKRLFEFMKSWDHWSDETT